MECPRGTRPMKSVTLMSMVFVQLFPKQSGVLVVHLFFSIIYIIFLLKNSMRNCVKSGLALRG